MNVVVERVTENSQAPIIITCGYGEATWVPISIHFPPGVIEPFKRAQIIDAIRRECLVPDYQARLTAIWERYVTESD